VFLGHLSCGECFTEWRGTVASTGLHISTFWEARERGNELHGSAIALFWSELGAESHPLSLALSKPCFMEAGMVQMWRPWWLTVGMRESRFHEVEPVPGLPKLMRGPLSEFIQQSAIRTVPYPLLASNTLVLSDVMVLSKDEKGDLALMFRCDMQKIEATLRTSFCG
jgi:hypothetical protein